MEWKNEKRGRVLLLRLFLGGACTCVGAHTPQFALCALQEAARLTTVFEARSAATFQTDRPQKEKEYLRTLALAVLSHHFVSAGYSFSTLAELSLPSHVTRT